MKQAFKNAFRGSVLNRANPYTYTNPVESGKQIGESIKKGVKANFNPKEPVFIKDEKEGRNINNLWTGYKLGGKGKIAMTASLLGGGAIVASDPRGFQNDYNTYRSVEYQGEMQDIESLPSTRGDGLGYRPQLGENSGLTASGDLVFAMHKTRHTGQF